jgi:hypothetical protein
MFIPFVLSNDPDSPTTKLLGSSSVGRVPNHFPVFVLVFPVAVPLDGCTLYPPVVPLDGVTLYPLAVPVEIAVPVLDGTLTLELLLPAAFWSCCIALSSAKPPRVLQPKRPAADIAIFNPRPLALMNPSVNEFPQSTIAPRLRCFQRNQFTFARSIASQCSSTWRTFKRWNYSVIVLRWLVPEVLRQV